MARCSGAVVVAETPTIPTYTDESVTDNSFDLETGSLTIEITPPSLCECSEIVAAPLTIRYDGQHLYDGSVTFA